MAIGSIDTEAALAAFVQREIEKSRVGVVARQLQSGIAGYVLELAVSGTQRKIAFGSGSLAANATQAVAHGLGVVPAAVLTAPVFAGTANPPTVQTGATATTFSVTNQHAVVVAFVWVAIG